ncbi:MAG: VTT domain-containing protein [Candidatus Pacearchaeota archaeon]|nr:VTT domain-containing protein [Candidatus Pacearchaeota archaeon]
MQNEKQFKSIFIILLIILLFYTTSFLVQEHLDFLEDLIGKSYIGMALFVLFLIISEVILPLTGIPLIPLASNLWGSFTTAILGIIGWTLGAIIAFEIARKYGKPIVEKLVSKNKIEKVEKLIPEKNIFIAIVLLRIFLPADILSYILGLFSKIKRSTYITATIIGITPFSFILAYIGGISFQTQVIIGLSAFILILFWMIIRLIYKKKKLIE